MEIKEIIGILKKLNKPFYTKSDFEIIVQDKRLVNGLIENLLSLGIIEKAAKDVYVLFYSSCPIENIATILYQPNYLSFESALSMYGILNQVPYTVTFATIKPNKTISIFKQQVTFTQIPVDLFWGYTIQENIYIAEPEKAFLDMIYIAVTNKYKIDMAEININKLSKKILLEYSNKFPVKVGKYLYG